MIMPASRWPGHLVVRAGVHYVFDATIGEASRPARGINLPDALCEMVSGPGEESL